MKFIIFSVVIFVFAIIIIFSVEREKNRMGVPLIEQSVGKQLNDMLHSNPDFSGIVLGDKIRAFTKEGDGDFLTGFFVYSAKINSKDEQLLVRWTDEGSKVKIIDVEVQNTYHEPRVLWRK